MYKIIKKDNGVDLIEVEFKNEFKVVFSNYGASIYEIDAKGIDSKLENVVLTPSSEHYFRNDKYLGLTVGRVAGRIEKGIVYLDKEYQIEANEKGNVLHSGKSTLAYRFYDYKVMEENGITIVLFNIKIKDMEDSFPGDLSLNVKYTVSLNNILLEYDAVSNKDTYYNLTNHSYFNMSGELKSSILDQEMMINKEYRSVVRDDLIFEKLVPVEKEFDFRKAHNIGDYIESDIIQFGARGYDHMFSGNDDVLLTLKDNKSKRKMTITSSYKDVVIYTNNYETKTVYTNGVCDKRYYGIAIEPSRLSLSMIKGGYRFKANKHYKEYINYHFEVEE